MGRSLIDSMMAFFYSFRSQTEEPVQARVENARMSQTRLKALAPVHPEREHKAEEPEVQIPTPLEPIGAKNLEKRIKTLADMSHYRLQAYAATLTDKSAGEELDGANLTPAT